MESSLVKWFFVPIGVLLVAAFVGTVMWSVSIGYSISSASQDKVTKSFANAEFTSVIDADNASDVSASNLYKIISGNRNTIIDYKLDTPKGIITDIEELLMDPTARWSVEAKGDQAMGYIIMADRVYSSSDNVADDTEDGDEEEEEGTP